jgi:integrase/recombinase XerD
MHGNSKEIGQHLQHLRLQGLSDLSVRDRRLLLGRLARSLPVPLLDATCAHLLAWRASLTVSPSAVVNYVSQAHCFYAWAYTAGLVTSNPAAGLPVPRRSPRLPRPIAERALLDILQGAPRRLRPWIVLAGWCGLRCQEIAWLRAENVHLDATPPYVLVTRETAKGHRERAVQLCDFAAQELAAARLPRRGWAFTRRDGQSGPNRPARVSELLCDHIHACGYADTAHSGRHRFLTEFQRRGKDIRITQRVAGHADLASTMLYTEVSDEAAWAIVQQLPAPVRYLRRAG